MAKRAARKSMIKEPNEGPQNAAAASETSTLSGKEANVIDNKLDTSDLAGSQKKVSRGENADVAEQHSKAEAEEDRIQQRRADSTDSFWFWLVFLAIVAVITVMLMLFLPGALKSDSAFKAMPVVLLQYSAKGFNVKVNLKD
jgi:cobalamin biosynthesis Mg chelatase CobN